MTKQFSEVCRQMFWTLITAVFRSLFHRKDARQRGVDAMVAALTKKRSIGFTFLSIVLPNRRAVFQLESGNRDGVLNTWLHTYLQIQRSTSISACTQVDWILSKFNSKSFLVSQRQRQVTINRIIWIIWMTTKSIYIFIALNNMIIQSKSWSFIIRSEYHYHFDISKQGVIHRV